MTASPSASLGLSTGFKDLALIGLSLVLATVLASCSPATAVSPECEALERLTRMNSTLGTALARSMRDASFTALPAVVRESVLEAEQIRLSLEGAQGESVPLLDAASDRFIAGLRLLTESVSGSAEAAATNLRAARADLAAAGVVADRRCAGGEA